MLVLLLAAINLRGVRESGTFFAIPTYGFMVAILGMCAWGFLRLLAGTLPDAESAELRIIEAEGYEGTITTVRAGLPAGPGVLVRLCGADRCRGDQQRRARVPQAQEPQRRDHAAAARR